MRAAGDGYRHLFQRKVYALAAAAYTAFVVYGSLVPLQFLARSLEDALNQFAQILSLPVYVDARTDVVTNVLLFVPYGYLLMATLCTDRPGRIGRSLAALVTIASGFALCFAIEFMQLFSVGRTTALSDIIAETCGGIVGVVLWLSVGEAVTAWLRDFSRERARSALAQRVLLVYCLGLFVSQVLPLDLTISLGELAQKYRSGRIVLQPFVYSYPSVFDLAWDYFSDMMLNVPLGAAAVVLWTEKRRRPTVALPLGIAAVALIEFCQVFVNSRVAAVTDVVTGSVGVLLGVGLATALSEPSSATAPRRPASGVATVARLGVAVWTVMLMTYHWSPFDFSFEPDRVTTGVHQLLTVPFYAYYQGTEFQAFTEMTRKVLLALPLGVLLYFSWPNRGRTSAAPLRTIVLTVIGSCLMLAVEVGQVFLPTRFPDVTDVIFGGLGVFAGLWVTGLLADPLKDRTPAERITSGASLRP